MISRSFVTLFVGLRRPKLAEPASASVSFDFLQRLRATDFEALHMARPGTRKMLVYKERYKQGKAYTFISRYHSH
jgi:hypothetical protein